MARTQGLYTQGKDESGLTAQQRNVLAALTDEGLNQTEAAAKLGLSRQRVRQIVVDLLSKGYELPNVRPPS